MRIYSDRNKKPKNIVKMGHRDFMKDTVVSLNCCKLPNYRDMMIKFKTQRANRPGMHSLGTESIITIFKSLLVIPQATIVPIRHLKKSSYQAMIPG